MPNRRYLEDWEKAEMTEEELFIEESLFACEAHLGVAETLIGESWDTDEIIEDVIEAPEPETTWRGFTFFSDFHSCTPVGDAQQYAGLRFESFEFCDDPECGGPGGWKVTWTNAP